MKKPSVPAITKHEGNTFPVLLALKEHIDLLTGVLGSPLPDVLLTDVPGTPDTDVADAGLATDFATQQTELNTVVADVNTRIDEVNAALVELKLAVVESLNGIIDRLNSS